MPLFSSINNTKDPKVKEDMNILPFDISKLNESKYTFETCCFDSNKNYIPEYKDIQNPDISMSTTPSSYTPENPSSPPENKNSSYTSENKSSSYTSDYTPPNYQLT